MFCVQIDNNSKLALMKNDAIKPFVLINPLNVSTHMVVFIDSLNVSTNMVRLVGGLDSSYGRLEIINNNGIFASVCEYNWNHNSDSQVVCKQLGYRLVLKINAFI